MAVNLFEELKDTLEEFKVFLQDNVATIQPVISALRAIFPDQIGALLNTLIGLMNTLKTEVNNIDLTGISNIDKVAEFAGKITNLVNASRALLPNASDEFDAVSNAASVISSLPTVANIKDEIIALIDTIIGHLNTLNAP
jgi:hypothetical protein